MAGYVLRENGILKPMAFHNWAEFYLLDEQGEGHWIPAHTAAYSWFGWTGAHELVIQKGDNIRPPHNRKVPKRYLANHLTGSATMSAV